MTDSATISRPPSGLRERKRAATRTAISDAARALTLEHGFSNFTIEQLCEQVGVSRRTFFNYFPSKEDALVGHHGHTMPAHLVDEFIRRGADSPHGQLSSTLLDDLVELACGLAQQSELTRDQYHQLTAVIENEPTLLVKILGGRDRWEQEFARLIAQREGLDITDTRVQTATSLLSTLSHKAGKQYFSPDNTDSYRSILIGYVTAARTLLLA